MKRKIADKPYGTYYLYGPTYNKSIDRNMVFLISIDGGHRTSTTYARYLMSTSLGRELSENEHVDHIDENRLNDTIGNLQILTPGENNRKSAKRHMVLLKCPECSVEFLRQRRQTYLIKNRGFSTCCGRSCSGKFAHRQTVENVSERLNQNVILEYVERHA